MHRDICRRYQLLVHMQKGHMQDDIHNGRQASGIRKDQRIERTFGSEMKKVKRIFENDKWSTTLLRSYMNRSYKYWMNYLFGQIPSRRSIFHQSILGFRISSNIHIDIDIENEIENGIEMKWKLEFASSEREIGFRSRSQYHNGQENSYQTQPGFKTPVELGNGNLQLRINKILPLEEVIPKLDVIIIQLDTKVGPAQVLIVIWWEKSLKNRLRTRIRPSIGFAENRFIWTDAAEHQRFSISGCSDIQQNSLRMLVPVWWQLCQIPRVLSLAFLEIIEGNVGETLLVMLSRNREHYGFMVLFNSETNRLAYLLKLAAWPIDLRKSQGTR
jgi:hypothetical protein